MAVLRMFFRKAKANKIALKENFIGLGGAQMRLNNAIFSKLLLIQHGAGVHQVIAGH